jgi:hypothetical protein
MNGLTQGIIQGISGGDILQGISSGGISSLVSTAVVMGGTAAGVDGTKIGGTLFFGTISGGFGAVLTNGNFWQGAATGLIVSGLNHVAHRADQENPKKTKNQLGIKNEDTTQTQISKLDKGMAIGDYVEGKEFDFIHEKASLGINKVVKRSEGNYEVEPTIFGKLSGEIKKGAKVSILQSKLNIGGKEQSVYKVNMMGIKGIKLNICRVTNFYVYKNYGYFYYNQKLMKFSLK